MGERHEMRKQAILDIVQQHSRRDLMSYGIAAKLPRDIKVTPLRVQTIMCRLSFNEDGVIQEETENV